MIPLKELKMVKSVVYNFLNQNVQYICGMSVPPIMMKKIAEQIKIQLLDELKK